MSDAETANLAGAGSFLGGTAGPSLFPFGRQHGAERANIGIGGLLAGCLLLGLELAGGDDALAQFDAGAVAVHLNQAAAHGLARFVIRNVVVDRGGFELLHTEPDAFAFPVDFEHYGFYVLAFGQFFFGMVEALLVGDIGDVDHALDAIRECDEGSELGEVGDRAFELGTHGELLSEGFPWIA